MKARQISGKKILQPCSLEWYEYQIDPYIGCEHHCHYCYTLNQNDTEKTEEILTYRDITCQLIEELSGLKPQTIYMGMNTDPYQPCDKILQQTRKVLELLAYRKFSACMLTKSDLITRDIDLIKKMPGSSAGVSIAFQTERVRGLFEAYAPSNKRRIKALKKLKESGIETYVLINPVMPFISDVDALIEKVGPYADTIWIYGLHMESKKDKNWKNVKSILERNFPDLMEKYIDITFKENHPYWSELRRKLKDLQSEKKLKLEIRV